MAASVGSPTISPSLYSALLHKAPWSAIARVDDP